MSIEQVKPYFYQNYAPVQQTKKNSFGHHKEQKTIKKNASDGAFWLALEALAIIGIGTYLALRGKGGSAIKTAERTSSSIPKSSGAAQRTASAAINDFSDISAEKITEAISDKNFRMSAKALKEIQQNSNIGLKPNTTSCLNGIFKTADGSIEIYQNGVIRNSYRLNTDNSYTYKVFDESGRETLNAIDVSDCSAGIGLV